LTFWQDNNFKLLRRDAVTPLSAKLVQKLVMVPANVLTMETRNGIMTVKNTHAKIWRNSPLEDVLKSVRRVTLLLDVLGHVRDGVLKKISNEIYEGSEMLNMKRLHCVIEF